MDSRPLIVGIGGRSCSGKSTAVRELERKHDGSWVHINQDLFFKINTPNKEVPEALRFDLMVASIKRLRKGLPARIPSESRTEVLDRKVKPARIILVEGHLIFMNKELNNLFDKKIWIDVSDSTILNRRTKRQGLKKDVNRILRVIIPESKKYEKFQKSVADLTIDGNGDLDGIIRRLEESLPSGRSN